MARTNFKELLQAGAHFGHLKRKWNPGMAPFVFDEKKGIHVIDLNKTVVKIDEAANAIKQIAKSGRKILFVATKKQAQEIVTRRVEETRMPFITERWAGGMLTNFKTTRKTIRKMTSIGKMEDDGTAKTMSKRERLQMTRQKDKLEKLVGSIADMTRLPAAVFIVDVKKEHIAVAEARKLGIPVFAMVDTNSDPRPVDFIIPANDDATKSIDLIVGIMCDAIKEGLSERKAGKEKTAAEKPAGKAEAKVEAPVEAKVEATEAKTTEAKTETTEKK